VVDAVVVDLEVGRCPTARADARVAVALKDGRLELGGDVAPGMGHCRDVGAVVEQDLDEGPGQDGPDGLGDRDCTGAGGFAYPVLAPKT
jgi:hypothetical protein